MQVTRGRYYSTTSLPWEAYRELPADTRRPLGNLAWEVKKRQLEDNEQVPNRVAGGWCLTARNNEIDAITAIADSILAGNLTPLADYRDRSAT